MMCSIVTFDGSYAFVPVRRLFNSLLVSDLVAFDITTGAAVWSLTNGRSDGAHPPKTWATIERAELRFDHNKSFEYFMVCGDMCDLSSKNARD